MVWLLGYQETKWAGTSKTESFALAGMMHSLMVWYGIQGELRSPAFPRRNIFCCCSWAAKSEMSCFLSTSQEFLSESEQFSVHFTVFQFPSKIARVRLSGTHLVCGRRSLSRPISKCKELLSRGCQAFISSGACNYPYVVPCQKIQNP